MEEHIHNTSNISRSNMSIQKSIIVGSLIIAVSVLVGASMVRGVGARLAGPTAGLGGAELAAGQRAPQAAPEAADITIKLQKDDRVRGDRDARFLLVEYSDIDCPFCSRAHGTLQNLVNENDDVAWAYRHFPLESIHPHALGKAVVAECAAEVKNEEAFWTVLDAMFEGKNTEAALAEAGLTQDDVASCVEDGKIEKKVRDQIQGGVEKGTRGTPNTIIWDTKSKTAIPLSGAQPQNVFQQAIESLR